MPFMIPLPPDFVPEEYGWERQTHAPFPGDTADPRFGTWRRARPGYPDLFESLVAWTYDENTGKIGAFFYPLPLPDEARLAELWERLRDNPTAPREPEPAVGH